MAAYRTRDARGASSTNDCRDPAIGAIDPWAQDLVDRVGSYTEVTVSGTRPRIIGRATSPEVEADVRQADRRTAGFRDAFNALVFRTSSSP
jgi:primase-polymerase (primpol)-like protein